VHESVHALAFARGVKETSRQGRYHNKKFVALAEELGMHYPHDDPHPTIGWSAVELNEETIAKNAKAIERLDEVISVARDAGAFQEEETKRKPRTVVCVVFADGNEVELTERKYEQLESYMSEHTAHWEER